MAVTAKFLADFSSFYTAVQKAEVSLRSFETGANRVEKSLNRMTDSFSGRQVIQDATLMAEAVNRIGGASKLTESEMARVNAKVTEAIAKFKALGAEAPQQLQDLAKATASVAASTEKLPGPATAAGLSFKSLFGAFSLANLATQAVSALTTEVADFVSKGSKLPALQQSFERLTFGIGQNSAQMLESLKRGTRGMVAEFDLVQSANKAMLLGLPVTAESMGELAEAATKLGRAMGMDATKSLDDLITALGRSSPMILDNLGLSVKLGEAHEMFAAKIGKAASDLTDAEKKMAFYEAAMEAARKKTEQLGESSKTLGEILTTVWTGVANTVTQAVGDLNVGLGRLLSSMEKFQESARGGSLSLLPFAVQTAAANERAEQLDTTLRNHFLANPPKGFGQMPGLKITVKTLEEMASVERDLAEADREWRKAMKERDRELEEAARKAVKAYRDHQEALRSLEDMFKRFKADAIKDSFLGEKGRAMLHDNIELTKVWIMLWTKGLPVIEGLGKEFQNLGAEGEDAIRRTEDEAAQLLETLRRLNEEGVQGFVQGLRLLSGIGGGAGEAFAGLASLVDITKNASRNFDIMRTAGVSAAAKIGAGFAGAASVAGAWLATQQAVVAILEKVDAHAGLESRQFLRASGALRDLNLQLRAANVNADRLFAIKDADAFNAAFAAAQREIEKTNAAIDAFGLTWRDFTELAQEYVTQTGRDLIDHFDNFTSLGVDAEKLLTGMSGALNQLVQDAVKTGSKIPSALRPVLEQLIRTKKITEETAAALLGMTKEAGPSFEDLAALAQRYGIELDRLGPKVNQLRITDIGRRLAEDFADFEAASADLGVVLDGMKDEVQELVTAALSMGLELPASMRPLVEALIRAGLLTDEFGDKLTDTSSINFSESLVDKVEDLIDAIRDLIDETDKYGDEAVRQFGRARNAAEILGRAIPRGFVPGGPTAPGPGDAPPPTDESGGGGRTNPGGLMRGSTLTTNIRVDLDGRQAATATARQVFA